MEEWRKKGRLTARDAGGASTHGGGGEVKRPSEGREQTCFPRPSRDPRDFLVCMLLDGSKRDSLR